MEPAARRGPPGRLGSRAASASAAGAPQHVSIWPAAGGATRTLITLLGMQRGDGRRTTAAAAPPQTWPRAQQIIGPAGRGRSVAPVWSQDTARPLPVRPSQSRPRPSRPRLGQRGAEPARLGAGVPKSRCGEDRPSEERSQSPETEPETMECSTKTPCAVVR